jgi:putative sterol carrier protein
MALSKAVMVTMALFVAVSGVARSAEQQLGVQVYAGAKSEPATAKKLIEMMPGAKVFCYSTSDGADKVIAFYKSQGLNYIGGDKENAMFKKDKVDVTIQRPWMDMATGKLNQTTLISIVEPAR